MYLQCTFHHDEWYQNLICICVWALLLVTQFVTVECYIPTQRDGMATLSPEESPAQIAASPIALSAKTMIMVGIAVIISQSRQFIC